jgi:hypothetical protein
MKKLMGASSICAVWASVFAMQRHYDSTFGVWDGGPLVRSLFLNYSYSFAVVLALSLQTYIVAGWAASRIPGVISVLRPASMPRVLVRLFIVFGTERYLLGLIESGFDLVAIVVMAGMGGIMAPFTAIAWMGFLVTQAVVFLWGTTVMFTNVKDGLLVATRNLSRSVEAIFLGMLVIVGVPMVWAWTSTSDPAARAVRLASVFSAFRLDTISKYPLPEEWFPWTVTVPMSVETIEFSGVVLMYLIRSYLGLHFLSANVPIISAINETAKRSGIDRSFRLSVVRVLYLTAAVTVGFHRILFWDLRLGQSKGSMLLNLLEALIPFGSNTIILLWGRSLEHLALFVLAWAAVLALLETVHARLRLYPAPPLFASVLISVLTLIAATCICDSAVFGGPISLLKASRSLFGS